MQIDPNSNLQLGKYNKNFMEEMVNNMLTWFNQTC